MVDDPDKYVEEIITKFKTGYATDAINSIKELAEELKTAREMCQMSFINNRVVTKKSLYWLKK